MEIWSGECEPAAAGDELRRHGCYGPGEEEDTRDAARIADKLGIPFHIFDLRDQYAEDVLKFARDEYLSGRTPNPCVRCNRMVKFGGLLECVTAGGLDFDYFATGHYVRTRYDETSGRFILERGKGSEKDQSYFLYGLSQEQLSRCMFPLGELAKTEVREMAKKMGLDVHDKVESQDFADSDYISAIGCKGRPGPILDTAGKILGQHKGLARYTIGQRRGIGIAAAEPLYVVSIDSSTNTIIVGNKQNVFGSSLVASGLNWIALEGPAGEFRTTAKIRYAHNPASCTANPHKDGTVHIRFDEPQLAVTPGQAVVFYDGDIVLGGGTINQEPA